MMKAKRASLPIKRESISVIPSSNSNTILPPINPLPVKQTPVPLKKAPVAKMGVASSSVSSKPVIIAPKKNTVPSKQLIQKPVSNSVTLQGTKVKASPVQSQPSKSVISKQILEEQKEKQRLEKERLAEEKILKQQQEELIRNQQAQIAAEMKRESIVQNSTEYLQRDMSYDLEKGLSFEVKTLHKHLKLTGEQMTLPVMVSVKTLDSTLDERPDEEVAANQLEPAKPIETTRPSLDLVCVIDNSGSMQGQKIENVKTTLLQLVDMLNSTDRLSLILFNSYASVLCNLRLLNTDNIEHVKKIIRSISSEGGTDIFSGVKLAFNILQNRKSSNQVTSVFLLSDGQDSYADKKIKTYLESQPIGAACFTMHSFGFGSDHDGPLMNRICDLRDGNFYYIEKISQVDEFFVDALGGLFSVVAQEVEIKVLLNTESSVFDKFFKEGIISKTFGAMWKIVKEGYQYTIQISQLFSGVSKDFIFEITLPQSEPVSKIEDFERNIELIQAELTAIPVDIKYTTKVLKQANLMLTLYAENETIAVDSEINDNVEFNYLRVQAASAMEEAIGFSDQRQYEQGQQVLEKVLKKMESAHPKNQAKLQVLKKSVLECQESAKPSVYEHSGKYKMLSKKAANYKQASEAIDEEDLYQNKMQKAMVAQQKKSKK